MSDPTTPSAQPDAWLTGDWMQTFTGKAFYPLSPRLADIDERDIAHALSLLCRYGGHVNRFYSVAEHCVHISEAVAPEHALWGLLHDATEAYLVDLPRPIKHSMPTYRAAEADLMLAICSRYGLDFTEPPEVKAADTRILVDERAALMGPPPLEWGSLEQVEQLGVTIHGWSPPWAEHLWLARFRELTAERAA